jgi:hypothetical protein
MDSSALSGSSPPRHVLLAAKRVPGTGNFTTSARIANILQTLGCRVELMDYAVMNSNSVDVSSFDMVIALHALHGCQLLTDCIKHKVSVADSYSIN